MAKKKTESTAENRGSQSRKDALRKMLLARRQEMLNTIEEQMANRAFDDQRQHTDSVPDTGDYALLDQQRELDISILENRNRVRQQIDEALIRLQEGTYGRCSDCGMDISTERLKRLPFAQRCVACQEKQELLEKIEQEDQEF